MATPRGRVYPEHPAVPLTRVSSNSDSPASRFINIQPLLPPQSTSPEQKGGNPDMVVIDLQQLDRPQDSTTNTPAPPSSPLVRNYGVLDRHQPTENDLVLAIQRHEGKLCPNLIEQAKLKIMLAEKKSPDRSSMYPLIFAAHYDLLDASKLANEYTLGAELKNLWLTQIATQQKALEACATKYEFILPEPPRSIPSPSKTADLPIPQNPTHLIRRIAAGIFALLALVFTARVAINHYLIKK